MTYPIGALFGDSSVSDKELIKQGILFYDSGNGVHKDSKGRTYAVPPERIYKIVENTNKYLEQIDIPVYPEHDHKFMVQIGEISKPLKAITITEEFVADKPKLKNLVGKVAIFSDSIRIKAKEVIDKIINASRVPISVGIDFPTNTIKEVSIVGIPALAMAGLFNHNSLSYFMPEKTYNIGQGYNIDATDLDSLLNYDEEEDENIEYAKVLVDKLFEVFNNINQLSPQELGGDRRKDLYKQQLGKFIKHLEELLPVIPEQEMLREQEQEQEHNPNAILSDQLQFSSSRTWFNPDYSEYALFLFNPLAAQQEKKKKRNLLGNIAKGALAVGTGAAAIRYGGGAAKSTLGALRRGRSVTQSLALGGRKLTKGVRKDFNMIRNRAGGVMNTIRQKASSLNQNLGNAEWRRRQLNKIPGVNFNSNRSIAKFSKLPRNKSLL